MIRAKGTVIVGGMEYQTGQAVQGLSPADIRWMKAQGFVEEIKESKKSAKKEETGHDISGDAEGRS